MKTENIQGMKYPGYGVCIYCGSDGGSDGLRDEHIIPFALGGNTEIKEASCRECERKINPVDTHLARSIFGQYRIHSNIQTRRPKERPTILPAEFSVKGNRFSLDLPIEKHPYSLALPVWGIPGFLRATPIDAPFPILYFHIYQKMPEDLARELGVEKPEDFAVWSKGQVNAQLFARAIAKIAYCHAVVHYGLRGFRPLLLPKIILGEHTTAIPYFVGVPLELPSPPSGRGALHQIGHTNITSKTGVLHLLSVKIRLFAHSSHEQHGMPIYEVIAGAPKQRSA